MPTYEYECTQGCQFEVEQSITDEPLKTCPKAHCPKRKGRVRVHRLISHTSFILKGGGWYSDGYSGGNGSPKKDSESSPKSNSVSGSTSKSDSSTSSSAGASSDPS
ncbi:MAG: FmdB family zinc ribbon protein [Myxococcota bacterium]